VSIGHLGVFAQSESFEELSCSMEWSKTESMSSYQRGSFLFGSSYGKQVFLWECQLMLEEVSEWEKIGFEARLATFGHWPVQMVQDPINLAEAGFYHTGRWDECRTFCCGALVSGWAGTSTAWGEHTRVRPECLLRVVRNK
jgi:hypothetical protein